MSNNNPNAFGEKDLISRQAAIDAVADGIISEEESLVECARECNSMIEWAVEALKKLPSAQPEIVRCKDCKHWKIGTENMDCPNPMVCGLHSFMHGFEMASLPEDYCSWAERRTDEQIH